MSIGPRIQRSELDAPEARAAIEAAEAELTRRYGADNDRAVLREADFRSPAGAFFVALVGDEVVGGVGIRQVAPSVAEVKRLWTAESHRRKGIAAALMAESETAGRELGFSQLILETGPLQPEAAAFYEDQGWTRVERLPVQVSDYPDALRFVKDL